MKPNLIIAAVIVSIMIFSGCITRNTAPDADVAVDSTRVAFTFEGGHWMVIDAVVNDSCKIKAVIETGWNALTLDSTFFFENFYVGQPYRNSYSYSGFDQRMNKFLTYEFNDSLTINIGGIDLTYTHYKVNNLRKLFKMDIDALVPINVTQHNVWEFNFDENYIKVHPIDSVAIPSDYSRIHIETINKGENNRLVFDLPIRYSLDREYCDTLSCMFDTGNPFDIFLYQSFDIIARFKKNDPILTYLSGMDLHTHYLPAYLFADTEPDTVSIRYYPKPKYAPGGDYVGMNFIKRFNWFINTRDSVAYIKRVESYAPLFARADADVIGGHFVDGVSIFVVGRVYPGSMPAKAGVQVGDSIIWFDGYSQKEIIEQRMRYQDVINNFPEPMHHFRVIRNRDTLDLRTPKLP